MLLAAIVVSAAVLSALFIVFMYTMTRGPHSPAMLQLSHLRCEKCGTEFDYAWLPGVSFTSMRLGAFRFFRCPVCGRFSVFNICDTRVDPETHHCPIQIGPG